MTMTAELTDEQIKTIFRQAKEGDEHAQFFINRLETSDLVVNGETLRDQFARVHEELKRRKSDD